MKDPLSILRCSKGLLEALCIWQPQEYEFLGQEHKVYRLKKELYGLKQAPGAWYSRIDSYLTENGFHKSESEPTLYTKVNEQGKMLIVCLYVDDLIFTSDYGISDFKTVMESVFEMIDIGLMNFFSALKFSSLKAVFLYHSQSMQMNF